MPYVPLNTGFIDPDYRYYKCNAPIRDDWTCLACGKEHSVFNPRRPLAYYILEQTKHDEWSDTIRSIVYVMGR